MISIKKKILIAKNFSVYRKTLTFMLESIGIDNISEAENGNEAIKILLSEPHDGIICDWKLEKISGLELLKKIKNDSNLKKLKVIMCFKNLNLINIVNATRAGQDGYLNYPFEIEQIKKVFNNIWS